MTERTAATSWTEATVREVRHQSPRIVMLGLDVPARLPHQPGQHYVVRLTAEDGYTASRSYSIASAPAEASVELCVERLADGEVSGYLADVVEPGDTIEVRGPIGGWFVWDGRTPALAIGGGSGVVPLVSMRRHAGSSGLLRLAVSAPTLEELPYAEELIGFGATVALTATSPRLSSVQLEPLLPGVQTVYVCGSARFAEAMTQLVVSLGHPPGQVRVERFGPTS